VSKRRKPTASQPASAAGASRLRIAAAVLVVGVAGWLAWASWRPSPQSAAIAVNAGGSIAASPVPQAYAVLVGEWVRPDGGYVLAVSRVAPDGKVTASYFNPRPIRVARAEARLEGALVGLFVELRDVNYPGSTYTLAYDAATDQLKGVYYQAGQGAQYEVAFSRRR
jgi:hypothetical protein